MEFVNIFLTKKQINDLEEGKTITVNQNGDVDVMIEFKDKKMKNKLLRNFKNGKGTRINLNMISTYKLQNFEGGKINIGKAFKSAGKEIKSGIMDVNKALKSNPVASAIVKEALTRGVDIGATAIGTATGNPIAGKFVGSVASQGVRAGLQAEGYGFNPSYLTPTTSLGGKTQISSFSNPKVIGGLIDLYENDMNGGSLVQLKKSGYRQIGRKIKQTTGGSFRGGSFKSPK